jgi:zinc/manganese transport system substrate-binding protein
VSPGAHAAWRAVVLLFLPLLLAACGSGPNDEGPAEDGRLVIATSTSVLADIVRNVAGPEADVWSVVPQGGDVHFHEASPGEIKRLTRTDLLVTVGANLEKFAEDAVWRRTARESKVPVLELAPQLELIKVDIVIDHGDHVHDLREGDPHIWLDPAMVEGMASLIEARLSLLDPSHASRYADNAAAYRKQLVALHNEIVATLAPVPITRRKLLVTHDAYQYFAQRYGFVVIGFVTPADNSEPSAKHVAELHKTLREANVPAVFREPNHGAKILEVIAREEGVAVGDLLSDSLSDDAKSYLDLMRYNARSIARHLR